MLCRICGNPAVAAAEELTWAHGWCDTRLRKNRVDLNSSIAAAVCCRSDDVRLSCPPPGPWLSWLERSVHIREVTGSSPVGPNPAPCKPAKDSANPRQTQRFSRVCCVRCGRVSPRSHARPPAGSAVCAFGPAESRFVPSAIGVMPVCSLASRWSWCHPPHSASEPNVVPARPLRQRTKRTPGAGGTPASSANEADTGWSRSGSPGAGGTPARFGHVQDFGSCRLRKKNKTGWRIRFFAWPVTRRGESLYKHKSSPEECCADTLQPFIFVSKIPADTHHHHSFAGNQTGLFTT